MKQRPEVKGEALNERALLWPRLVMLSLFYRKGETFMAKHLNPLEKEFLIHKYRSNQTIRLSDFCSANSVSNSAFRKWLALYDKGGLEGLSHADAELGEVLPAGIDRTEEAYKREILRLRIENERLKKNYTVRTNEDGQTEYVRLKTKSSE